MVGDEGSLLEATARVKPLVVIADIAMAKGDLDNFVAGLMSRSPHSKIVLLTLHDEPSVAVAAARAGAHGIVLKRSIGAELLSAIDEVLAGRRYVSPGMRR
jgi:DNA-binding NarL/FixJ family response regulator